jgi:hypothetical protein
LTYDSAQALSDRYGPSYRWLVTITGMVGVVSMVLAMTTVNVAVPDVMGAFRHRPGQGAMDVVGLHGEHDRPAC